MRILHTADWHLGRLFHRVSLLEEQRVILFQIIEIADEKRPDVVLIAGDVYDRAVPPADAVRLLDEILTALVVDRQIPTVVVAGNHDSMDRLAFGSRVLSQRNLHLFGAVRGQLEPVVLHDEHGPVAIHALPYPDPMSVRDCVAVTVGDHRGATRALVERSRQGGSSATRSVLVTHALVEGGRCSESERPLSLGEQATVPPDCFEGFDYVALGHLHCPQQVGDPRIQYAGSILAYSFSEAADVKSVTIADIDGTGQLALERVPLDPRRRVRIIEGQLEAIVGGAAADPRREDFVKVRLTDTAPILGAVSRLREVYPNVLEVERSAVRREAEVNQATPRLRRDRDVLEQFADFYEQVSGEPLPDDLVAELRAVVDKMHADEARA